MALRILVAPLDWGLGHATRCIPIVRALRAAGHEVLFAADAAPARLLGSEFPDARILSIVNYNIRYGASRLGLYLRFPGMVARVLYCAGREHREVEAIVRAEHIDVVIADNRFGCHTKLARSIYMTHQFMVKFPRGFGWLERLVWAAHGTAVRRFDEVWVPDSTGDDNLTGDLTHKYALPANCRFVGPLSRFAGLPLPATREDSLDLLVMLSGPEPQRSLLEKRLRDQLAGFTGRALVALGQPSGVPEHEVDGRVTYVSHLTGERLHAAIVAARAIVCRGGYTSIMELVSLGRTAILVPTPGQSEQEYLCGRLAAKSRFVVRSQSTFSLAESLEALAKLPQPVRFDEGVVLSAAVAALAGSAKSQ